MTGAVPTGVPAAPRKARTWGTRSTPPWPLTRLAPHSRQETAISEFSIICARVAAAPSSGLPADRRLDGVSTAIAAFGDGDSFGLTAERRPGSRMSWD